MTNSEKNTATLTHLSSLTQYFIPFGNFIFPAILWSSKKEDSQFIDFHGKQVLNFQLSIFLYSLFLALIGFFIILFTVLNGIDFSFTNGREFIFKNLSNGNISVMVMMGIVCISLCFLLKILEFFMVLYAAVKASNGENYHYPLTINFLK